MVDLADWDGVVRRCKECHDECGGEELRRNQGYCDMCTGIDEVAEYEDELTRGLSNEDL